MVDIERMDRLLEGETPENILLWASATFGSSIAVSSSFQTQSLPLLHIVSRTLPALPVLFLDTGYHFPETLSFRDRLVDDWGLNLMILRAAGGAGPGRNQDLYRTDPDGCCYVNKVEPMRRATQGLDAWISGIRRDQSQARSGIRIVEKADGGVTRIHPLASWTAVDVQEYIDRHELPPHPLLKQGYTSVGCAPCTRAVPTGSGDRDGRWVGTEKTECGLHTTLRSSEEIGTALVPLQNGRGGSA